MAAKEQVVVEFTSDTAGLEPAVDQLVAIGAIEKSVGDQFKKTNAEMAKQQQVANQAGKAVGNAAKEGKKGIDDLDKATRSFVQDFIEGFQEGVLAELQKAGVSLEDFINAIKNGPPEVDKATNTIKARLKEITIELQRMKLAGLDNTEQYKLLTDEAGNLKDTLGDVAAEIANAGSDTGVFDGLIEGAQGAAGGLAIFQGALGLAGVESEDLQEVLLKVNSAMAVLQGLQAVQNTLQKESAAFRLADVVATKAQVVVQQIYTAVTGKATAATTAFKVALASTGIGLALVAIAALVAAFNALSEEVDDANDSIERNKQLLELDTASIEKRTKILEAQAELAGKAESDLTKIRGRSLQEQLRATIQSNEQLAAQRDAVQFTSEAYQNLNKAIEDNNKTIDGLNLDIQLESLKLQKQLADEAKKAAEEAKKRQKELADLARAAREAQLKDELAALQRQLLAATQAGTETLKIEQDIISKKADIELNQEKLTRNQIKLIQEQAAADREKLQKEHTKTLSDEALKAEIARTEADLKNINLTNKEKLDLQTNNLITAAQLEINGAEGNSAKIKEIIATRERAIKDLKLDFLRATLEEEIALEQAKQGAVNRQNQRTRDNEKNDQTTRLRALNDAAAFEINLISKRIDATEEARRKGLISEQEYNLAIQTLQDEQNKIVEDAEAKRTEIIASENEKRKAKIQETVNQVLDVAGASVNILQQLYDNMSAREQINIDNQRNRINELKEAGAITEKESIQRLRHLEQEEKRVQVEQARRQKQINLFQAILNTAAAVTKALSAAPPPANFILAGIAAALGAAQIALIASRPIPAFFGGKKNDYEGPGKVGEAGAELIEKDGQLFIAQKSTLVWLNKEDKVFNPKETADILAARNGTTTSVSAFSTNQVNNSVDIDYDRLGKAVGENIPRYGVTIDREGITEYVEGKHSFERYLNNRRMYS